MIKNGTIIALKVFLFFVVLTGLVYPLGITAIAQLTMPYQANGSLISEKGKIVGSKLIGQAFDKSGYFHSRPSAVNYDAAGSGASNLAPSSKKLMNEVADRVKTVQAENNIPASEQIPADMVLASASGLDPHISVQNAMLQVSRVANERNLPEDKVKELVDKSTDHDFFGLWGQPGVNVLELNLALDKLAGK
jgi:potassium-transporting ATPase KdpC subunit